MTKEKKNEPVQIDLVYKVDFSEYGLGKREWDYDPAKPAEVAEVKQSVNELEAKAEAIRSKVVGAQAALGIAPGYDRTVGELIDTYHRSHQPSLEGSGGAER